jgi:hypothetical protein
MNRSSRAWKIFVAFTAVIAFEPAFGETFGTDTSGSYRQERLILAQANTGEAGSKSVTLTPDQLDKLIKGAEGRTLSRLTKQKNAGTKADSCTAFAAACATAAAMKCIFQCSPPAGYPGSAGCSSCVDAAADTCYAASGC